MTIVYFYGIPALVADFLERAELPNLGYLSAVCTAEYPNVKENSENMRGNRGPKK